MGEITIEPSERARRYAASIAPYIDPAPVLVVISGPSGVGKDSVIERMRQRAMPFHFVVTTTDRAPRPSEVDGVDYDFVSADRFQEMIAQDAFFEHAFVYRQYKGVPKAQVRVALATGTDVVMRLDVQGAETVKKKVPEAISIFVMAPSLDALVQRLSRRGSDSPEQVERRLRVALSEMECISSFDYVVVNRDGELDSAVDRIVAIMDAVKSRTRRREIVV